MKIEIELDDLSTDVIKGIIDAMKPALAEAQKNFSSAKSNAQRYIDIATSNLIPDNEYNKVQKDAYEAVEAERQCMIIYHHIMKPMNDMQSVIHDKEVKENGSSNNSFFSKLTKEDIDLICETTLCCDCPLKNTKYCRAYHKPGEKEICK